MAGQKSQKGRKIGRNKNRPSAKVYLAAKRWETNKVKRVKRHTRRMAKKAIDRIEWEKRTRRIPEHAKASELQALRQIVSQNHTG